MINDPFLNMRYGGLHRDDPFLQRRYGSYGSLRPGDMNYVGNSLGLQYSKCSKCGQRYLSTTYHICSKLFTP